MTVARFPAFLKGARRADAQNAGKRLRDD